jgi:hypothetical protein
MTDSIGSQTAVALATRASLSHPKRIECLYLKPGQRRRYRLFSTVDPDLNEVIGPEDLDPVEFDIPSDIAVATYLIESLWRLHVSPGELERQLGRVAPNTATTSA